MRSNVFDFSLADQYREAVKRRSEPPPSRGDLPVIRLDPGQLYRTLDEVDTALLADGEVFRFGETVVRVAPENVRIAGGGTEQSLRHPVIHEPNLLDRLSKVAVFQQYSKTKDDYVTVNCPRNIAEAYLERRSWGLPSLLGIITAPTIRADGTIFDEPGYDEESGLIFAPLGVKFLPVADRPTKAQCLKALRCLTAPISLYRFTEPVDRAVALSGIMTAICRLSVPTAPMHAVDAPVAASGKSMLVDVASIIATGHAAPVTATGGHVIELDKRLSALILAGDTIINIDNLTEDLNSVLLCQLLTQTTCNVRILGKTENIVVPSTQAMFSTGNNMTVLADLTRRVLVARIDPGVERPELTPFPFNPARLARRYRRHFVRAALTIMRGYITSGDRVTVSSLGSYEEWSRLVREPLVWLGEDDPVSVIERTRKLDPRLQHLRDVTASWAGIIGVNHVSIFTRDIISASEAKDQNGDGYTYPEFRESLRAVAKGSGNEYISPDKLGWWFRRNKDRMVSVDYNGTTIQVHIMQDEGAAGPGAKWILASAAPISINKMMYDDPVLDPHAAPF